MHEATMARVASSLVSASSKSGFQSVSAMCSSCEREQWKMDCVRRLSARSQRLDVQTNRDADLTSRRACSERRRSFWSVAVSTRWTIG